MSSSKDLHGQHHDHETIRRLIEELSPFAKLAGLSMVAAQPMVRVKLPQQADNLTALGSVSASAVFTLAETCASAACLSAFGASVIFECKTAEINFRRPGAGALEAVAMVSPTDAVVCLQDLEAAGVAQAHVVVEVLDQESHAVATAEVTFEVRRTHDTLR